MEELVHHGTKVGEGELAYSLPDITEYGVRALFRFAVIGQTDSGKMYSIMRQWLGGRISYWTSASGRVQEVKLRHCLYCNNGNVSLELKQELVDNFIVDDSQRVFHLDRFPTRDNIFDFILSTSIYNNVENRKRKLDGGIKITYQRLSHTYVFAESSRDTPYRVIVLDDLMVEAFDKTENRDVMKLLMTKLSHHNNISILIVCHELYPKGKNAVLLREQLMGVHIHSLTNVRKIVSFIRNYLNDKEEDDQYVKLFEEHVSRVSPTVDKCNRRGSIIVKFNVPSLKQQQQESPLKKGRAPPVGQFITFNDRDHAVVHENYHG